jgi:hypothetical protein
MDTLEAPDTGADTEPGEAVTAAAPAPVADDQPAELETAPSGAPMVDADGSPYTRWRSLSALEGVWTGDDRYAEPGTWTWRDLPLTLKVQPDTTMGHDGAKIVGRIDTAEVVDASQMIDSRTGQPYGPGAQAVMMTGVFNNRDLAQQTIEDIRGGFLGGVSADPADVRFVEEVADWDHGPVSFAAIESGAVDTSRLIMQQRWMAARFTGLTITPFPAWEGTYIEILDDDGSTAVATKPGEANAEQAAAMVSAAAPSSPRRCVPCEASGMVASAAPVLPPAAWFGDPVFVEPTPLTVDDDGRVYGHLATWDTCHIGITGRCVTPPRSVTGYALFNRKPIPTADGPEVQVGPLTVGTGHADTRPGTGMFAAISHYDNTGTAVADVTCGEDSIGIWIAGALRPDASDEQIRMLRASSVSGDWREWAGSLELGAILAVNTPGFPVLKQVVASGRPTALIAAAGPPPVSVLDEVGELLPEMREIVEERRTARVQARADRALTARTRARQVRAAGLRSRLAALTSKETA